ncbi:conserved hypothetical protein [Hyphomicrobiales bacterium]|nr:conserved hypothetical protein [Hyphomicrobiales bacterium]CAH1700541.1 conserved hypothetical protein [Hyphomicrobiales bacterium]CAI0344389.1 conserved hypothetical protein [Hyphomicrobiales bacterium]
MAYRDEIDAVIACERELRRQIATRIAVEAGVSLENGLPEAILAAADAAIDAWRTEGEEQQDLAAFRAIGPLQALLAEHRAVAERIDDMLDRRLG